MTVTSHCYVLLWHVTTYLQIFLKAFICSWSNVGLPVVVSFSTSWAIISHWLASSFSCMGLAAAILVLKVEAQWSSKPERINKQRSTADPGSRYHHHSKLQSKTRRQKSSMRSSVFNFGMEGILDSNSKSFMRRTSLVIPHERKETGGKSKSTMRSSLFYWKDISGDSQCPSLNLKFQLISLYFSFSW